VVSVTTDKVYENRELQLAFHEGDRLGGHDPYSSSKACADLVTAAFRSSYFSSGEVRIATARAGNVIGGGDWSEDRLLPDLIRGFISGEPVRIRRPEAVRPWQHVLEPVYGYLLLAEKLLADPKYATAYNFGPSEEDARPVKWIAERMAQSWGKSASWVLDAEPGVHEAGYLRLDAGRAEKELGWVPRLRLESALDWLVQWYRAEAAGQEMQAFTLAQIAAYEALAGGK
jgi:CDP-glucose 4,6-dehydratase